jgi:hypothetical protein
MTDSNKSSFKLDRLQDAIVEDIINTSDEDILAEVAEEYGDPLKIARDMQVIIDRVVGDAQAMPRQQTSQLSGKSIIDDWTQHVAREWHEILASWSPVRMVQEGTLGEGSTSERLYSAIEKPLENIFDTDVMTHELKWAAGRLRIMCARSAEGGIRSVMATIDRTDEDNRGAQLVLSFRDRLGERADLTLGPDNSSSIVRPLRLSGELEDIELDISLKEAPQ